MGFGRNRRRGIRQARTRRSAVGHDRDGAPTDPEDHRARGLLVRRHLVDRVRDRGDPLRRRGRRLEPRARARHARADRASRSRSCSRSSSRRTARRSSPTRAAAAVYVVSRENLGENPSLVAGASLLVDYILTVAVSISAGVAAIVSIPAFQDLARPPRAARPRPDRVHQPREPARRQGVGPHLRGTDVHLHRRPRRARRLRALPQLRARRHRVRSTRCRSRRTAAALGGTLGLFLLLKGFSSGAVALTGVEAISNGVPAFRRPESKNAATTLVWMGVDPRHRCSSACRSSPTTSARTRATRRPSSSQLGTAVFGDGTVLYVRPAVRDRGDPHPGREHRVRRLPAAVVDHRPRRLPAAPAREPWRPAGVLQRRPRPRRARRALLIVAFGGITNALIPLYAVGVFLSFTLSQAGMVRHHQKERERGLASATS